MSYVPSLPSSTEPKDILEWVGRELTLISQEFNSGDFYLLKELHSEPVKPRTGMVVFADGTDWDPGDGRGYYGYDASSWVKLSP